MPPRIGAGSGPEPEPQWPPRSPHEALLSTPSGRERLRRLAEQASPSQSPSKRPLRPISARSDSRNPRAIAHEDDLDLGMDDDEDEETLELQLAAIQAKLKLKKVQAAKAKKAQGSDLYVFPTESRPVLDAALLSRARSHSDAPKYGSATRPQSQGDIQVPASPVRRAQTSQDTTSPSRVRLGIDKGLRAKDVSLKRAPNPKKAAGTETGGQGGYLRRTNTPVLDVTSQSTSQERPKSFSERLAAARMDEEARRQRQQRAQQVRTKAFNLGQKEMEELKEIATDIPETRVQEEQYSREEVIAGNSLKRDAGTSSSPRQAQVQNNFATGQETIEPEAQNKTRTRKPKIAPAEVPEEEALAFEPYSGVHLKKRIIPHLTLTRNLASKKTYTIPDLLKHVKAPDFQLPDVEQDIVVFGMLASKSAPKSHQNTGGKVREKMEVDPGRKKYMAMTLVDLKWEVDLFLFNSGFDRYWKLTPGTLLAILNPTIMPPHQNRTDTGRFSLVISSDEDTILEVGVARDLGFCKSVKKDGSLCSSWVNTKRTEFCEFHMNMALSKKRLARQDVNAFDTGLGPQKKYNSRRLHNWETHANDPGKKTRGNYDRDTQSAWFMRKPTAASMIDNEVLGGEFGRVAGTIERKEALRRRLATEEKERDLMKKLSETGRGAGKEYMLTGQRSKTGNANESSTSSALSADEPRPQLDAKSLGLVSNKTSKIHLSPIKRKRGESVLSSRSESLLGSSVSGTSAPRATALGWGGGLKDKLTRMREGEKLNGARVANGDGKGSEANKDRSRSPARKKTRFVTEKGIREAGRESLGDELGSGGLIPQQSHGMMDLDDDDDDELIILR